MEYYKINGEIDLSKFNYPNQHLAVIAHIINEDGAILLQKRGNMARDNAGIYEDVSGAVEEFDQDFTAAIKREIKEEIGDAAQITLRKEGIYHLYKNDINWLFIIFLGTYYGGALKIMEPDKCLGYKFFTYEELEASPIVSESSKYLAKMIRRK